MSASQKPASYRVPRPEHALVADAMRHGIFSCPGDTTLRDAARVMALHHVHAIVVTDTRDGSPWGILTDVALVGGLLDLDGEEQLSCDLADSDYSTISSGESVIAAAELMRERGIAHILVRNAQSGRLAGMLSTLDIAGILAWGEA